MDVRLRAGVARDEPIAALQPLMPPAALSAIRPRYCPRDPCLRDPLLSRCIVAPSDVSSVADYRISATISALLSGFPPIFGAGPKPLHVVVTPTL
jgi:hypothetical protein